MGGPGSGRRKVLDKIEPVAKTKVTTAAATRSRARKPAPIKVKTASGLDLVVLTEAEKAFYRRQVETYLEEFGFTSPSDKADLDTLVSQELMNYRWTQALITGKDHAGEPIPLVLADQYRRNQNDAARSISQMKTSMGMTRAARDADKGSVQEYISGLLRSAKAFGTHRNEQVILVLTLFNELSSIVGTFDRSNQVERQKVGIETEEDIVEWVRSIAIPRYKELDQAWVDSTQKYFEDL